VTTNLQPLRWPAARSCPKSKTGEEAPTPEPPVALSHFVWKLPRRSALANYRPPLALPQSSGRVRNPHVSLNPLSVTLSRRTTPKTPAFVQKLWTKRLPCGSHWKSRLKFPLRSTFAVTRTYLKIHAAAAALGRGRAAVTAADSKGLPKLEDHLIRDYAFKSRCPSARSEQPAFGNEDVRQR